MTMNNYIDEIKLELTGGLLDIELPDTSLATVVNKALREVQRYIDTTRLMTVPFASCIDLKDTKISSVSRVFRAEGYLGDTSTSNSLSSADPMYVSQWQILSGGGSMYNLNDWVLNYASWNSLMQVRNTTSTDMAFKQDKQDKKLYINALDKPAMVTIEYIPVFDSVEEIDSDYWIDVIVRWSIALTKIILGRIRTRYTQSNALWTNDGEKLLEEGNSELNALRERLGVNSQLCYPID